MNSSNKLIFIAELIGTFGLVVGATGSIVYDGMLGGIYGIGFSAAGHFVALAVVVYAFGKYSMAHFNPAVTIAFFITKHVKGATASALLYSANHWRIFGQYFRVVCNR